MAMMMLSVLAILSQPALVTGTAMLLGAVPVAVVILAALWSRCPTYRVCDAAALPQAPRTALSALATYANVHAVSMRLKYERMASCNAIARGCVV